MIGDGDFEYANQVRSALEERAPRTAWVVLLAVALLVVSGIAWARYSVLEEVTSGQGRVIPSRQIQVVQTHEGGVVSEIGVAEGAMVVEGQVVMRIDDTGFSSRLGEFRQRRWALLASILRSEAQAAGLAEMAEHAELQSEAPLVYETERESFRARRSRLEDEVTILAQQLVQRQQELEELLARHQKYTASMVPLARELDLTRSLHERGVVPEVELLRLERQAAELDGDIAIVAASVSRARSSIVEAEARLSNLTVTFQSEAREKLATARAELAIIDQSLTAAEARVVGTTLTAPVRGIVNTLLVTTVGAVTQPGQAVMEIVPLDDTLLIEARIRPQDVAFIRPGQAASVKLTAYDYAIYGALEGSVERIGADTVTDERGESYYQVIVRTIETSLEGRDGALPIIPGMVATVDILTGEKTVFDYLVKPVLRMRHEAMRER